MTMLSTHLIQTNDLNDYPSTFYAGACFFVSVNHTLSSSNTWILDLGASRHICPTASQFINMHPLYNSTISLPNKTSIPVHFTGDISLHSNMLLKDVLFVPSLQFNFLSVSVLLKSSQFMVSFFTDHFIIQDVQTKRMIGKDNKIGDLYVFTAQNLSANLFPSPNVVFINHVTDQIWHYRLGHLSNPRLDILKDKMKCTFSKSYKNPCYICPLAKQRRLSFVSNDNKSSFPFDLVHCDIWGPYSEFSHSGHRFFFNFGG